ncbi:peptide chain release factor 2 [candidate division WWE3 bacterium CG08_land_8_20_14_0_20_40_13]|uniref:Peptide chain release factor 2 n=1 Tax=candidate division WWE3 bacterium CG08_land_8_20_14_0_20_40_13 TaxID=1975084 RepID=A0A2H0XDU2_UNCKA|nr:MAG: peptide chain release factor 2 [candidate division WWE3 bacterium CG08_land_8_20_14_0_20_40_13]
MIENLKEKIEALKEKTEYQKKKDEIAHINKEMEDTAFWSDPKVSGEKMKTLSILKEETEKLEELDLYLEESLEEEVIKKIKDLEILTLFSGRFDQGGVYFSIYAGQGGTEAMDWAGMLSRMYERYFTKKNWDFFKVDETTGEEAGIKSVTYQVDGRYAYGYLKNESGAHRLVRQSPFNADNLRQTSFAQIEVIPQIGKEIVLEIPESELEIDFFRASGHGGQNVNKVSTAVRLKHKPSGLVVSCQTERYQNKNREIALNMLKAKLVDLMEKEHVDEIAKVRGDFKPASWGYQIRNYVLHPYKLVKDLRTGVESTNPDAVLDGDLDIFLAKGVYL